MPRQSRTYRTIWTVAGVLAALAIAVRGLMGLDEGVGVPLLIVALAIIVAVVLRHTAFPD